ncbi:PucR family transcriptional regulator [Brevibacillus daliensis]|uniref:PucR family transcriptional regulator n=1 Tax=Brevibacillus daliensis TaxID=2892995 RepID=UPI001E4BA1E2|nr:helix-turn-helix domain-containing protein [Brevibacillus daliensis]
MPHGYFDQHQHSDINELADVIGELLQNPVTIEDMDHRLLAYSSHSESTDQARWSTIMGRRVPEKVLTRLWKDGVFQHLFSQVDPVHIPEKVEIGLGQRVAIAIRRGSDILGYIWAQEVNRPLTSEDDEILRQAAKAAVPLFLQRQGKRKAEEGRRKEFLWELLLGSHRDESLLLQKAAKLQMEIPPPFLISVVDITEPQGEQLTQLLYPLLMRDKVYNVTDGSQVILLICSRKGGQCNDGTLLQLVDQFMEEAFSKIVDKFGEENVFVGCGRPVQTLTDSRQSYQEALQMVQVKRQFPRETRHLIHYNKLGLYRMLAHMHLINDAQGYTNEGLGKLLAYDRENQTNLMETLEVFLDHVGKVNVTASQLHIHINTLSYRLKRIEEITGYNLDDPNDRFSLYADLKLLKI